MSTEQMLAFREHQRSAMTSTVSDFITSRLNSTLPPADDHHNMTTVVSNYTVTEYVPRPTQPVDPNSSSENVTQLPGSMTDVYNPDNVNVTSPPAVDYNYTTVNYADVNSNTTYDDRHRHSTTTPPRQRPSSRPPSGYDRPGDSHDPFDSLSQLLDLLNTVPDTITQQNVQQFLSVLFLIPAADIASRLAPSAVS